MKEKRNGNEKSNRADRPGNPEKSDRVKEKNRKFYDEAFTEVFSNRQIIESLLRDFVDEPWVKRLDFDSMEIERSVFKDVHSPKRESDLLLSFRTRGGGGFSIFVLIEFQSSTGPMLLRLLEYLVRIYNRQQERQKKSKTERLSPVIPLVIYNGERGWRESPQFIALFPESLQADPSLLPFIPNFRYILIDENSFSDAFLSELKEAAAYFFLLDKTDIRKREKAEARILGILKELKSKEPEVFELLGRYVTGYLKYRGVESREITEYITDRGRPMLLQSMDKMFEQAKKDGLEEGLQEGREKGIREGRREGVLQEKKKVLIKQLDLRFGLGEEEISLIRKEQSLELLDRCLDKILFSSTKEEVLEILKTE